MKNNKVLIIIGVIFINVLAVFMISQSLFGKTSQYDLTLEQARDYYEQELCSKSVEKYNEAILIKDTINVRLEMLEVYKKGLEIGEFTKTYDVFTSVTAMVDAYRESAEAYEAACALLIEHERYEDCAKLLMQARDLNVTSEKIEEYRSKVRYQYMKYFAMYKGVAPSFDGMYTVQTDEGYTFLNDEGSPEINVNFIDASSFSEGYAFVKGTHPDGKGRSIIINKNGERQAYLNKVSDSSGVGRAKDANGADVLLLACKVGKVYKYFDINGNEVFGEYAFAGRFRNNVAAIKEKDGKWKLIDGTGKAITETVFKDVILNEFDECAPKGIIIAKQGKKYNLYDLTATKIGDFSCDKAKAFVDDYAAFEKDGLWGFVGADGTVIIKPQYEDAKSFSNNMGAIKNSEGWNFISPENKIVIQETFEDVGYLNGKGICFVKFDGSWSYLKMYYTGK